MTSRHKVATTGFLTSGFLRRFADGQLKRQYSIRRVLWAMSLNEPHAG